MRILFQGDINQSINQSISQSVSQRSESESEVPIPKSTRGGMREVARILLQVLINNCRPIPSPHIFKTLLWPVLGQF